MASACGLLSTRKNLGEGVEQAEPLTLHVLGREWMYTERAFLLVSQAMHQNPCLESEKEIEVNLN